MALSRRALLQGATGFAAMNTLAAPFQAAAQATTMALSASAVSAWVHTMPSSRQIRCE